MNTNYDIFIAETKMDNNYNKMSKNGNVARWHALEWSNGHVL